MLEIGMLGISFNLVAQNLEVIAGANPGELAGVASKGHSRSFRREPKNQ